MKMRLLDNGEAVFATAGPAKGGGSSPQLWVASVNDVYMNANSYRMFNIGYSTGEPSMHEHLANLKKIEQVTIRSARISPVVGKLAENYDYNHRLLRGDVGDESPFHYRKRFPPIEVNVYYWEDGKEWRVSYSKRNYTDDGLTEGQRKWLRHMFDAPMKAWAVQETNAIASGDPTLSLLLHAKKFAKADYLDRLFRDLANIRRRALKAIDMVAEHMEEDE